MKHVYHIVVDVGLASVMNSQSGDLFNMTALE